MEIKMREREREREREGERGGGRAGRLRSHQCISRSIIYTDVEM